MGSRYYRTLTEELAKLLYDVDIVVSNMDSSDRRT
jgi:hypothetical protein